MKSILLQGCGLCKTFSRAAVLDHINVTIYEKDFTVIMGASGAGKSTLLYCLSGMDGITGGEVLYKGKKISGLTENEMAKLRGKEFGFVFQQANLVGNLTLLENVKVAGYAGKVHTTKEIDEMSDTLLRQMGLGDAMNRLPSQASGGECQRAALVRATINDPGLIFADEPTGALNRSNSDEVLELLTQLNRAGQSILMVTHDVRSALRGNRVLDLEDGKLLDELDLGPYTGESMKERESKLTAWLTGLHW